MQKLLLSLLLFSFWINISKAQEKLAGTWVSKSIGNENSEYETIHKEDIFVLQLRRNGMYKSTSYSHLRESNNGIIIYNLFSGKPIDNEGNEMEKRKIVSWGKYKIVDRFIVLKSDDDKDERYLYELHGDILTLLTDTGSDRGDEVKVVYKRK